MGTIIIILLVILTGLSFLNWKGNRSMPQSDIDRLGQKVGSLQKTMDDTLVRIMFLEDKAKSSSLEKEEEKAVVKKPLNLESVRIALRYNGFSPEISSTNLEDWQTVRFKIDDTFFRIDTSRLPYLTLDLGFRMNNKEEDLDLMYQAARDVTTGIFVGKVNILRGEEESAVVFQAEFIADNYLYFRDHFKEYLNIVIETHKRFFEVYNDLKEEKKKQLELVDQVMTQMHPGPESKKIVS